MSGRDREIAECFDAALQVEEYDLLPGDAAAIAKAAACFANEHARDDPMLGSGRDTRAVFALAEGITIGAMAWREAEKHVSPQTTEEREPDEHRSHTD